MAPVDHEESVSIHGARLSRRGFLAVGGALVVAAGTPLAYGQTADTGCLDASQCASWFEIRADNSILYRTGKSDFGQSTIYTAYPQIIADELGVPFEAIIGVVSGDTDRTPDGGGTFGMLRTNAMNLRKAAAYMREAMLELAAKKLGAPREQLSVADGVVTGGGKSITYGQLVQGQQLTLSIPTRRDVMGFSGLVVDGDPPLKPVAEYKVVGKPFKNPSIGPKMTGKLTWVGDVKLPGMLHARVVHPATLGSTLVKAGTFDQALYPGARVVTVGNLVAVVAPTEWAAIQAAQEVAGTTQWSEWSGLPGHDKLFDHLRDKTDWKAIPTLSGRANAGDIPKAMESAAKTHAASYQMPYFKHAPIGPSVALADVRPDGSITIHTHSQNPQFLRKSVALMLGHDPAKVVVRTYPGPGHYGRSNGGNAGSEDEAVLLSKAVGRPVRVQWMRADDMQWSTQSSASFSDIRIGLDADGRMLAYQADHYGPPMQDDRLVGAMLAGLPVIEPPMLDPVEGVHDARTRVVDQWIYANVGNLQETGHGCWQVGQMESPLKIGLRDHSMRTPIQFQQNFPREMALSEAAALAGVDALQFRMDHAKEPRVRDLLKRLYDESGWDSRPSPAPGAKAVGETVVRGRGVSVMLRENGYWACAAHVTVTPATGAVRVERITLVVDPGIVVNPLQLKRQAEAGCLMGVSQSLHEEVTFDGGAITSTDWGSYPILTMEEMPDIKVSLIHRPETGVYGQGSESANALAAPAIAGAIFDATGKPPRRLPMTPDYVKGMLTA